MAQFELYGRAGTGSAAVEALLEIVGAEFKRIDVPKDADGKPPAWFLEVNPRGEVPVLRLADGSLMTESAAIMIHLADLYVEKGLAPSPSSADRARYLRWIVFIAASTYACDLRLYYPERISTDVAHAPFIKAKAQVDLDADMAHLAANLGDGPYILGSTYSAADIYADMVLTWAPNMTALFARHPALGRFHSAVSSHPVVRQVWGRHGMV